METIDVKKIGNKIRGKRLEKKLSQTILAEHLGTHQSMISSLENGERLPDLEFAARFSEFFEVSLDWLIVDLPVSVNEDQEEYAAGKKHEMTAGELELLQILETVPDIRETIKTMIELPERKRKIYLGKMLEDLEKLEEERKG